MKKLSTLLTALLFSLAVLPMAAFAADYPTKPITLVVPYGAGGSADLAGRTLATAAQDALGQPVLVVNKTGASGATGSAFVQKAKPDGYTLLLARVGSQSVYPAQNLPNKLYNWDGFTFLTILDVNPYVFLVMKDSPYKTLKDLADDIKAKPGKLKYSHSGPATVLALGPQMLAIEAGGTPKAVVGVPFTSDADSKVALLGGNVDFLGVSLPSVLDQIKAGTIRALAVVSEERLPDLPEVPTVTEAGFPGLMPLNGWSGLYGPSNLPKEVMDKWTDVLAKVKSDKTWLDVTTKLGNIPVINSSEEAKEFVRRQIEAFSRVYQDMK